MGIFYFLFCRSVCRVKGQKVVKCGTKGDTVQRYSGVLQWWSAKTTIPTVKGNSFLCNPRIRREKRVGTFPRIPLLRTEKGTATIPTENAKWICFPGALLGSRRQAAEKVANAACLCLSLNSPAGKTGKNAAIFLTLGKETSSPSHGVINDAFQLSPNSPWHSAGLTRGQVRGSGCSQPVAHLPQKPPPGHCHTTPP